jgi:hypothetical protein
MMMIAFPAVRSMGITPVLVFPGGWGIVVAAAAPRFKFGPERSDVSRIWTCYNFRAKKSVLCSAGFGDINRAFRFGLEAHFCDNLRFRYFLKESCNGVCNC